MQDSEPVTALAVSPDGRLLFAASRSLQLRCWSIDTGQALRSFRGHKAPVADMDVDRTGALLATASADRSVRVWDIDGGFCTHSFTGHRCVPDGAAAPPSAPHGFEIGRPLPVGPRSYNHATTAAAPAVVPRCTCASPQRVKAGATPCHNPKP